MCIRVISHWGNCVFQYCKVSIENINKTMTLRCNSGSSSCVHVPLKPAVHPIPLPDDIYDPWVNFYCQFIISIEHLFIIIFIDTNYYYAASAVESNQQMQDTHYLHPSTHWPDSMSPLSSPLECIYSDLPQRWVYLFDDDPSFGYCE